LPGAGPVPRNAPSGVAQERASGSAFSLAFTPLRSLFRSVVPRWATRTRRHGAAGRKAAREASAARAKSIARLFEAALLLWVRGQVTAPGVEPWLEFRARIRKVLALVRSEARGQSIAVFTAAGVLAAAMQFALSADDETALSLAFRVRNSSVSEFVFSKDRFSLVSFNETPHLEDAALLTVR